MLATDAGLGMTGGLMTAAVLMRMIWMPLQIYSQMMSIKGGLLHPDV